MGHESGQNFFTQWAYYWTMRLVKDVESMTLEQTNATIIIFFSLAAFVLIYLYVKSQTPLSDRRRMNSAEKCSYCLRMCLCNCRWLYFICGNSRSNREGRMEHTKFSNIDPLLKKLMMLNEKSDLKTNIFVSGLEQNILRAGSSAQLRTKELPSFCEILLFASALTISLAIIIDSGRQSVLEEKGDMLFRMYRGELNSYIMLIRGKSSGLNNLKHKTEKFIKRTCEYFKQDSETPLGGNDDISKVLERFNDFSKLQKCVEDFKSDRELRNLREETYDMAQRIKAIIEQLQIGNAIEDSELSDMIDILENLPKGECFEQNIEGINGEVEKSPEFDKAALNGYLNKGAEIRESLFLTNSVEDKFKNAIDDIEHFQHQMEIQHTNLVYQALAIAFVAIVGLSIGCYCKNGQMIESKIGFYKIYAIQMMLVIAICLFAYFNVGEITNSQLSELQKKVIQNAKETLHKLKREWSVSKNDKEDINTFQDAILRSISKLSLKPNITTNKAVDLSVHIKSIFGLRQKLSQFIYDLQIMKDCSGDELYQMYKNCARIAKKKLKMAKRIHKRLVEQQIVYFSEVKDTSLTNGLETITKIRISDDFAKLMFEMDEARSKGNALFNNFLEDNLEMSEDAFDSIYSKYRMLLFALILIFLASLHMCLFYK